MRCSAERTKLEVHVRPTKELDLEVVWDEGDGRPLLSLSVVYETESDVGIVASLPGERQSSSRLDSSGRSETPF